MMVKLRNVRQRMKVSFFSTCLVDQVFPQVGACAVRLLRRLGVEVDSDPRQTCCGQPAFNTGYTYEARKVVSHFLKIYREVEKIVVPSGSCAAMIKCHVPEMFPEDSPQHQDALAIAARTFELSEFLVSELGVTETGAHFNGTVTYHDSCHQLRELGISEQPRALIRSVKGIQFVEMKNSTRCCGFGGTFSVKFPDISVELGRDKLQCIQESNAEYVIATDVSCLMHLDGLLKRERVPITTMHLAELLVK